jgi:F0F1-type ATP synthase membrane subunit b/b'
MDTTAYKRDVGKIPEQKDLSFPSKEALGSGATLQNTICAKIFYKGCEPESADAKTIYDLSYRFMSFAGVVNDFDPSDPESVKKVFDNADAALKERDKNISDLQQQVKDFSTKLAEKDVIVKDKDGQLAAENGKWSLKCGGLKFWLWFILISVIVLVVVLGGLQIYTTIFMPPGVPFLTGPLGGFIKIFKFAKQTIKGIETHKADIENRLKTATGDTRNALLACRDSLNSSLSSNHDEAIKKFVANTKKKMGI